MAITRTIDGEVIEFKVNQAGHFEAKVGDDEVNDATLAGAEEQARKLIKKQHAALRTSVEITVLGIKPKGREDFYGSSAFTGGDEAIDFLARRYPDRTRAL